MPNGQTKCHPERFHDLMAMDTFDSYYFNKCLDAMSNMQTGSSIEPKASFEKMKFHADAISAMCDYFISRKNDKQLSQ